MLVKNNDPNYKFQILTWDTSLNTKGTHTITLYLLRFANTFSSLNDRKSIWSHISSLRFKNLKRNIGTKCAKGFIPTEDISDNFDKLSQMVGNINRLTDNLSTSDLYEASKMFSALNLCPSFLLKVYWDAIYGPSSRIAMFASNILKKAKGGDKEKAIKIFAKISSMLGFQHISYHQGNKSSGRNYISLKKNLFKVKGLRQNIQIVICLIT